MINDIKYKVAARKYQIKEMDDEIIELKNNFIDNKTEREWLKNHFKVVEPIKEQLDSATYEMKKLVDTLNEWENIWEEDKVADNIEKDIEQYKEFFSDIELRRLDKARQNYLKDTNNEEMFSEYLDDLKWVVRERARDYFRSKYPSVSVNLWANNSKWKFNIDNDLEYNKFVSSMIDEIPIITDISYFPNNRSIYLNGGNIRISNHLKPNNKLLSETADNLYNHNYKGVINLIYNDGKLDTPKELELLHKIFKEYKGGVDEFILQQRKNDLQQEIDELINQANEIDEIEQIEEEVNSM